MVSSYIHTCKTNSRVGDNTRMEIPSRALGLLRSRSAAGTVSTGKTRPLRPELNFNFQTAQFKIWKESGGLN